MNRQAFAVLLLAVGCQTYDFERVEPLAIAVTTQSKPVHGRNAVPNLMLLVDKSGSMNDPVDPMKPACRVPGVGDGGTLACTGRGPLACDTAVCPTRMSDMKAAMSAFLSQSAASVARVGVAFFPNTALDQCSPSDTSPDGGAVNLPTNLAEGDLMGRQMQAELVSSAIQGVVGNGGTPTAGSLHNVAQMPGMHEAGRKSLVLLLTDGLPNCNQHNPTCTACTSPSICDQYAACNPANASCLSNANLGPAKACGDSTGSVAEIEALAAQDIRTIVVGFGAETAQSAGPTLNAMALAGGFPRQCSGSGCATKYYQTSNANELTEALAAISKIIGTADPCVVALDATPATPDLLSVMVDGVDIRPGPDTWHIGGASDGGIETTTVIFSGSTCEQLKNATPQNEVKLEFRILEKL